jgi:hypothetical protein
MSMSTTPSTKNMKLLGAAVLCGAALSLTMATPASAGEITGNGKDLEVNARSICAFSGLNDEITEEEPFKTQNWGTIPKEFRDYLASIGVSPRAECNAHANPIK